MEHKGTVYFFTGLSGAGKTTVGSLFYQRLKNTKPNAVYLDGDEIRVAFGEDVGYTNDERLRWAGRIFRVCRLLSDQGIDVVCCSIAMFDTVRRWNREHIPNYKEISFKNGETPIDVTAVAPIPGYQSNRRRIADFLLRGLRFVNKQGQPLKMMKPLKLDPALLEQPLYH